MSVIIEFSCSILKASGQVPFIAAPPPLLFFLSHSASSSMDCCFRDLVTLRLALLLSLMMPRGVRLLLVFVRGAGRFLMVFSVVFGVGMTGAFRSPLTTEALDGAEGWLLALIVLVEVGVGSQASLSGALGVGVYEAVEEAGGGV